MFPNTVNSHALNPLLEMDFLMDPAEVMSFASALFFLLLTANWGLDLPASIDFDENFLNKFIPVDDDFLQGKFDGDAITLAAFHNLCLCNVFSLFDDELGF